MSSKWMDCISCQDLANDSGQTEEEEEEDRIAFPELWADSGWTWTQLKNTSEKLIMTE